MLDPDPPVSRAPVPTAHLGLNDGKGGERAAAHGLRHLGRSFQQARVKVEHIAGVGLTL